MNQNKISLQRANLQLAITEGKYERGIKYNRQHPGFAGSMLSETKASIDFLLSPEMDFIDRYDFSNMAECKAAVDEWIDQTISLGPTYFVLARPMPCCDSVDPRGMHNSGCELKEEEEEEHLSMHSDVHGRR